MARLTLSLETELKLINELSGNEYKIYRYLMLKSDDYNTIHNITREEIQSDCNLGYTTVYQSISKLKEKGLLEYHGNRKMAKLLPV